MRKTYASTNKAQQAAAYYKAGQECERAGFLDFAEINYQMAAFLDPPRDEEDYY